MSHISILSAPLPSSLRTSTDDTYFPSQPGSGNQSLTVPESFLRPSRSRSNSLHPQQYGANSLPGSPVSACFPQRPSFRRALTTATASSVSTPESTRFDELHYSQTHFSRSTLLVYSDSQSTLQLAKDDEQDGDIRELLIASSDEESSQSPSTPGFETTRIPPRGSSVSLTTKQSMESDKSVLEYNPPIALAPPPKPPTQELKRNGLKMSQSGAQLAGKASRSSVSSQHNDGSVRSNASSSSSLKRRSRMLMKIIPFVRESSTSAESAPRFSTLPRARTKTLDEPVPTLAERFAELELDPLSPPLSASSFTSSFSSTPATSPEMGGIDVPGRRSGSQGRREGCRLKGTSSRESVRSLFASPSMGSPTIKPSQQEESEWEETLQSAASRASWHSSINHRPRKHTTPTAQRARVPSQSTWPRTISNPVHQRDSLLLEHVFFDASDDGRTSAYAESSYSGYPADQESLGGLASRDHSVVSSSSYAPPHRELTRHGQAPAEGQEELGQGRFGTLPRVKTGRPSTTGSSVRGEPARFGLQTVARVQRPAMQKGVVLGTASLGRATSLRRRPVEAAAIWQMGRRRSSGVGGLSLQGGSFSAGGARMMPTIPQGHSRETSLADSIDEKAWQGIDPCTPEEELFARGYSVGIRQDSLASDGSGEVVPLQFGSWRRESHDDLALLSPTRRDSIAPPVFNLSPFRRPTLSTADFFVDSPGRRFSRSAYSPDVPEAVTSASDAEDNDDYGWCRRRSTFSDQIHPHPTQTQNPHPIPSAA